MFDTLREYFPGLVAKTISEFARCDFAGERVLPGELTWASLAPLTWAKWEQFEEDAIEWCRYYALNTHLEALPTYRYGYAGLDLCGGAYSTDDV